MKPYRIQQNNRFIFWPLIAISIVLLGLFLFLFTAEPERGNYRICIPGYCYQVESYTIHDNGMVTIVRTNGEMFQTHKSQIRTLTDYNQ